MRNNYLYFKRRLIYTFLLTSIGIIIPLLSHSLNHGFSNKIIEIYQNRWFFLSNFISVILLNIKYHEIYQNYNYRIRMKSNSEAYLQILNECIINIFLYWIINLVFLFIILVIFNYKIYQINELIKVLYVSVYNFILLIFTNILYLLAKKVFKSNLSYIFLVSLTTVFIIIEGHILFINLVSNYALNYILKYILIIILSFFLKKILKKEEWED